MKPIAPLIAFTGLATSGKTSAVSALHAHRIAFADPLKEMVRILTASSDKESRPPELCGKSVREALQSLGTDWGRNMIGENIWIEAARKRISAALAKQVASSGEVIVIDDCRFDNEAELIKSLGGIIIRIERPGLVKMSHASEAGISDQLVDHTIRNDGDLPHFLDKVRDLVYSISP